MNNDGPQSSESAEGARAGLLLRLRGLKVQIVLWTILPLTLVLIGVAFTGVYSHERAMRKLVQERDQALAVVSAGQVADLLRRRATALQRLAAQEAFQHRDQAAQQQLLAEAADMNGLFAGSVALLELAGDRSAVGKDVPSWVRDMQQVVGLTQAVMNSQDVAATPAVVAPGEEYVLLISVPVFDDTGIVYGVMAGPMSLDSLGLENLLDQVQVGEHGIVYLVDDVGEVLVHSPSERAQSSLAGHTGLDKAIQDPRAIVSIM